MALTFAHDCGGIVVMRDVTVTGLTPGKKTPLCPWCGRELSVAVI